MLPSALLQRSPASALIDNSSVEGSLEKTSCLTLSVPVLRPRANINRNEAHFYKTQTLTETYYKACF